MALSEQVESSLKEAESNLRNALAFAARNEKPFVSMVISKMINDIDNVIGTDKILSMIEDKMNDHPDMFGK
jgi:hypothetical protein